MRRMRTSLSTKVALLQAKAVANGATPAEARAAAKVTELTQADERENAARILMDQHGWSEVQANGVVSCFDRLPVWDGRDDQWRFSLLWDWASAANKKDPLSLATQLEFLNHDLCNGMSRLGGEVGATKTEEEARKAFRPYAEAVQ